MKYIFYKILSFKYSIYFFSTYTNVLYSLYDTLKSINRIKNIIAHLKYVEYYEKIEYYENLLKRWDIHLIKTQRNVELAKDNYDNWNVINPRLNPINNWIIKQLKSDIYLKNILMGLAISSVSTKN